jgi:hypothetical protein
MLNDLDVTCFNQNVGKCLKCLWDKKSSLLFITQEKINELQIKD